MFLVPNNTLDTHPSFTQTHNATSNFTQTHNTTSNFVTEFNNATYATGYNVDLGVQLREGTLVNHSTMDEFFQQLNGSTSGKQNKSSIQESNANLNNKLHGKTNNEARPNLNNGTKEHHAPGKEITKNTIKKETNVQNVKKSDIPHAPTHKQVC